MSTPSRPLRASTPGAQPHVAVVGAGITGLATAWFLQEHGVRVSVLDRSGIAAGASWGNAGWLSPGLAIPLAEPSILTYGLKALRDPDSPLYVPLTPDPGLASFLLGFAARCTMPVWRRTMAAFVPVNRRALDAVAQLEEGMDVTSTSAPIMAAFRRREDAQALVREFELIREAGLELSAEEISSEALRARVPVVSSDVETAVRIDGQRHLNPGEYLASLSRSVQERGGELRVGATVHALRHGPQGITVEMVAGEPVRADAVVLATGAWLPELARPLGVRTALRAGRGYSFSVAVPEPLETPVYFPHERIACTPLGDRLRLGGTMEFRGPDDPLDPNRIEAIARSASRLFDLDLSERDEEWVGPRPVTVDSLPLVGALTAPHTYVNGGHGMWGMTQGPRTAALLAEQIVTGEVAPELRPMDPLRRTRPWRPARV